MTIRSDSFTPSLVRTHSLSYRSPLLWFVLPFGAGVVAGRLGVAPAPLLFLGLALILVWAAWYGRAYRSWAWGLGFSLAMVLAGVGAYQISRLRLAERESLPARELDAVLSCEHVFSSSKPGQCSLIGVLTQTDSHLRELRGQRVYVGLKLAKGQDPPLRSESLRIRGLMAPLVVSAEKRDFSAYLSEAGVAFRITRCSTWHSEKQAGLYARFREAALGRFGHVLEAGLAGRRPELAGILKAMMLGRQSDLSIEQKQRYMLSGTMHLFAISGLHIAVIAGALAGLIAWVPLGPWGRFCLAAALLWFYVDATGASPSAVRSYLMVVCVQFARLGRLPGSSLSGICMALSWALISSPLDLFSAGFQMSYGIVAALILMGQPLTELLLERLDPLEPVPVILRSFWMRAFESFRLWALPTASLSLSAALVSLLSGVAFFGVLSHGSILANLLMIPASVLVIYAGFVSLVCGLVGWEGAAALFNYGAGLVLWGMDALLNWFVALPVVYLSLSFRWTWLGGAGLGAFLLLLLFCYARGWGRRGGLFWLPPLFLFILLSLGSRIPL